MIRGRKWSGIVSIVVFITLEAVSFAMIYKDSVIRHYALARASRNLTGMIEREIKDLTDYFGLRSENDLLQRENCELRQLVADFSAQIPSGLPDHILPKVSPFSYLPSRVIHNSVNASRNFILLDKGSEDGVCEGMGVVTHNGIVGVVDAVGGNVCRVVSLLSTDMQFSAKLKKNNVFGLLVWPGRSSSRVLLTEVPTHSDVAEGDTVTTSGFSSIFPSGIPIGVVLRTESNGVSINVAVDLFQDFHSLDRVYLVANKNKSAIDSLLGKR